MNKNKEQTKQKVKTRKTIAMYPLNNPHNFGILIPEPGRYGNKIIEDKILLVEQ